MIEQLMENQTTNALVLGMNPGLRETLRQCLRGRKMNVLECTHSGAVAFEKLSTEIMECDLIISELKLKDGSCKAFLEKLRTVPFFNRTLIILIAGEDENDLVEECLPLGIAAIIRKPFNSDKLEKLIEQPIQRLKQFKGNYRALFLNTYAHFFESISRLKTAINYHHQCLAQAETGFTHFDLGRLYLAAKNRRLAEEHLNLAEKISPEFKRGKEILLAKYSHVQPENSDLSKRAIKAFLEPRTSLGTGFYNSHILKKGIIVGGDHGDRVGIKSFLASHEIRNVILQEDPEQALKLLVDSDMDFVISFLKFPSTDALALTKALRNIYTSSELKILIVANENQKELLLSAIEAGADGYVIPPFTTDRFSERMHGAMLLADLATLCQKSAELAKASYILFEWGRYAWGRQVAEKGFSQAPTDYLCELFLAMNLHMLGEREAAFSHYENVVKHAQPLSEICAQTKVRLEALCPRSGAACAPQIEWHGEFRSVEEMQNKLFGKVEKPILPKTLSARALERGVTELDLVQPLGLEAVVVNKKKADFGRVVQKDDSIRPWIPTESLMKCKFDCQNPDFITEVDKFAGQGALLNSRVVCLPRTSAATKHFLTYLQTLGRITANKDLLAVFKLDTTLDMSLQKLMAEVKNNGTNAEKAMELGIEIITKDLATELFQRFSTAAADPKYKELIAGVMAALKGPLTFSHRECLNGKKEFENTLPTLLEHAPNKKPDFAMLYKAMEMDHNSFESFKKVYASLEVNGGDASLDEFFKARYKDYLASKEMSAMLRRFLLAMGDEKRANLITEAPEVDEIKKLALEAYKRKDYHKVLEHCRKLIEERVHLEFSYNLLGVAYKKMGSLEKAIKAYEKGLEVEPKSIKLYHNIALAYSVSGDAVKAKAAMEKSKQLKEQGLGEV